MLDIEKEDTIVNVANSILNDFKIQPFHRTLKDLDRILKKDYQNIVLLVCDGLGSKNLKDNLDKNSFLRRHKLRNIQTVFPPTTTAATTSFLSGLYPSEHNWYGWDMYFKDTNETISLFLNRLKDSKELPKKNVFDREYMQYKSLIDLIREKGKHEAYILSPFSNDTPCHTLIEISEKIKELSLKKTKKFIYAYIENPDKMMHYSGIYSKVVKDEINNIDKLIENLVSNLDNTLLIVSADHGLITTKTINLKKDYKDLYDMLERTISIELRTCGIKLKSNVKKEEFESKFKNYFQDYFNLLSIDCVRKSNLFGPNQNEYLYDNIGDYLAIATGNLSLIYDDNSPIFKANHAGFTNDELTVPLIVIECKN